jgi:hypothetical protein
MLFCVSVSSAYQTGKLKSHLIDGEVICLKEIQKQMTPYLKSFEEEGGVKYKYNVKSGLSYKDTVGLRLQINRVDSGLNDRLPIWITTGYRNGEVCASQRTWYLIVLNEYGVKQGRESGLFWVLFLRVTCRSKTVCHQHHLILFKV